MGLVQTHCISEMRSDTSEVVCMSLTDLLCVCVCVFVFVSRTSVEDVPGGAQRVSAGEDRPDLLLQR